MYVNRNYQGSINCIQSTLKFITENSDTNKVAPNQMNEILLLMIRNYERLGQYKEGLKFYNKNKKKIADKCEAYDLEGRIYKALDNEEKSVQAYEALLDLNPANIDTYYKLINAKGIALTKDADQELSADEQAKIKETLLYYEDKYRRVGAHMRISIRHLQGEDFSETLRRYTKPMMIKGVPSMLQDLRELYTNSDKIERIYNVLNDCLTSMEKEMTLSPSEDEEE